MESNSISITHEEERILTGCMTLRSKEILRYIRDITGNSITSIELHVDRVDLFIGDILLRRYTNEHLYCYFESDQSFRFPAMERATIAEVRRKAIKTADDIKRIRRQLKKLDDEWEAKQSKNIIPVSIFEKFMLEDCLSIDSYDV